MCVMKVYTYTFNVCVCIDECVYIQIQRVSRMSIRTHSMYAYTFICVHTLSTCVMTVYTYALNVCDENVYTHMQSVLNCVYIIRVCIQDRSR